MPYYWIRNKKGQVAAEVSDEGVSVHDQGLSWQLQKLKEAGEVPYAAADTSEGQASHLDALLRFFAENGYTVERKDT